MATLRDVAHLPCLLNALVERRHPLLTARDVAALVSSGALGPAPAHEATLRPVWARIARDLELAFAEQSPMCQRAFSPDLSTLDDPNKVVDLDAAQVSAIARDMGVRRQQTAAETADAVLAAHRKHMAIGTACIGTRHAAVYHHLGAWRVTKTTALRVLKIPASVLAGVPHTTAVNPHGGQRRMRLYRLLDVFRAADPAWTPSSNPPPSALEDVTLWTVECPTASGKKRARRLGSTVTRGSGA